MSDRKKVEVLKKIISSAAPPFIMKLTAVKQQIDNFKPNVKVVLKEERKKS